MQMQVRCIHFHRRRCGHSQVQVGRRQSQPDPVVRTAAYRSLVLTFECRSAKIGTQGVPCYPKRKRIDAFDEIDLEALNHAVDNDDTAPPHVSSLQVQVGRRQSQPDPVVVRTAAYRSLVLTFECRSHRT